MFSRRKPSPEAIAAFLAGQRDAKYSHPHEGATRGAGARTRAPAGFTRDHHRQALGRGPAAYARARAALSGWAMFNIGWVELHPRAPALEAGTTVAVLVRAAGLWALNGCRVAYRFDEDGPVARYGFAYGTLDHAEAGEERFSVEWNRAEDTVVYDLLAFSRPRHPLAKLGFPLVRRYQRRFARDTGLAMREAVRG